LYSFSQLRSGVRQSGVLSVSPALFNIYVRSVVHSLIKSDLGYYVCGMLAA